MSSDSDIEITQLEAKYIWDFLCSHESELNMALRALMIRIESRLWDGMSIDEMARNTLIGEKVNE